MKYSDLLNYIKFAVHPDKDKIKKQIYQKCQKQQKRKKSRVILMASAALFVCVLVITGSFAAHKFLPRGKDCDLPSHLAPFSTIAAVKPSQTNKDGTIPKTVSFEVTTTKTVSKDKFKEIFHIHPKQEYTLARTSGNTFTVTFGSSLKNNTLYTVKSHYDDTSDSAEIYSWAFQTESDFAITDFYPKNNELAPNDSVFVDFSHTNVNNFEESFTIYPAVSGTFEKYGNRWKFIPSTEFEPNVLYTVTISQTVTGGNSENLETDFSFSFMPTSEEVAPPVRLNHSSNDMIDSFPTETLPAVSLFYNGRISDTANVEVYKFTAENFINIHKLSVGKTQVTAMIEEPFVEADKLFDFTAKIEAEDGYGYFNYPEILDSGFYISKISIGKQELYQFLQVNDISVYSYSLNDSYTFWANNKISGLPEKNARVTLGEHKLPDTDENGLTTDKITFKNKEYEYLLISSSESMSYVSRIELSKDENQNKFDQKYNLYLQTDKNIYHQGEKIKVFGIIRPLDTQDSDFECFSLKTSWANTVEAITVNSDGIFEYETEIPVDFVSGTQNIELIYNGEAVSFAEFEIIEKESAFYSINCTVDKEFYYADDEIEYTVCITLPNGERARNTEVIIDNEITETTNKSGIITFTKKATSDESGYNYTNIKLPLDIENNKYLSYTHEVRVLPGRVHIATKEKDGKLYVNVTDTENNIPIDTKLNVLLHRVSFEKKAKDSIYNPLTQRDDVTYSYIENDEIIAENDYQTINGECSFDIQESSFKNVQLYYEITAEPENEDDTEVATVKHFIFTPYKVSEEYAYVITSDKDNYTSGETCNLTMYKEGIKVVNGNVLITYVCNGRSISKFFSEPTEINFEIPPDFSGEISIYAAYFDGADIHIAESHSLTAKTDSISVEIITEGKTYKSGEEITAQIITKGKNNAPISATVNISLLSDRINKVVNNNQIKISKSPKLSTSKYSINKEEESEEHTVQFTSIPYNTDSISYQTVVTDENGNATIKFTAPDQSGSWNLSAVCVYNGIDITEKIYNIKTKNRFNINTKSVIKSQAKETVLLFSIDSDTTSDHETEYEIELKKNNEICQTYSDTARLNKSVSQNFGKLEPSNYTATIRAEDPEGNLQTVQFTFDVKDEQDYHLNQIRTIVESESETKLPSDSTLANILIFDEEAEFPYTIAQMLLSNSESAKIKDAAYSFLTNKKYDQIVAYDIQSINDVKTAAIMQAAYKNSFCKKEIEILFKNTLSDSNDRLTSICCYMGLATLNKPVLNELFILKAEIEQMNPEEKIYLSLAFACAGDYNTANKIYNEHIAPKIITANGIAEFDYQGTKDEAKYLTAALTQLCGKLSTQNAKDVAKSLLQEDQDINKYSLQLLSFINDYFPALQGENSLVIEYSNGSKQEYIYEKSEKISAELLTDETEVMNHIAKNGTSIIYITLYDVYTMR